MNGRHNGSIRHSSGDTILINYLKDHDPAFTVQQNETIPSPSRSTKQSNIFRMYYNDRLAGHSPGRKFDAFKQPISNTLTSPFVATEDLLRGKHFHRFSSMNQGNQTRLSHGRSADISLSNWIASPPLPMKWFADYFPQAELNSNETHPGLHPPQTPIAGPLLRPNLGAQSAAIMFVCSTISRDNTADRAIRDERSLAFLGTKTRDLVNLGEDKRSFHRLDTPDSATSGDQREVASND